MKAALKASFLEVDGEILSRARQEDPQGRDGACALVAVRIGEGFVGCIGIGPLHKQCPAGLKPGGAGPVFVGALSIICCVLKPVSVNENSWWQFCMVM